MNKNQVLENLNKPNGVQQLAGNLSESFEGAWALFREGNAPAAGLLALAAKQKQWREEICRRLCEPTPLLQGLKSESFKMRKNAARLCGALGDITYAEPLIQALEKESVGMVRPSQILALGFLRCSRAEDFLKNYRVPLATDANGLAHQLAEEDALRKALAAYGSNEKHPFIALPSQTKVRLLCPEGTEGLLAKKLQSAGGEVLCFGHKYVDVLLNDLFLLAHIRFWSELLISFGEQVTLDRVGELCNGCILPFLKATHRGEAPFRYRLELKNFQERGKWARTLSRAIDGNGLVNDPSDYEVEFRLIRRGESVEIFVKLYTLTESRFSYRKRELPASIHPVNAAGALAMAAPWLKANARVADPCCGSGTMLLERAQLSSCSLYGVDISAAAIEAARENFNAAQCPVSLQVGDSRFWNPDEPLDEIISNLPFGNRVGGHVSNRKLYEALVQNLPRWLVPKGIAVLYTTEKQLLRSLVYRNPALKLLKEFRTDAGGLQPTVMIIQKK